MSPVQKQLRIPHPLGMAKARIVLLQTVNSYCVFRFDKKRDLPGAMIFFASKNMMDGKLNVYFVSHVELWSRP